MWRAVLCLMLVMLPGGALAQSFSFADIVELSEMKSLLASRFSPGDPGDTLRYTFLNEGEATGFRHPEYDGVEKYVYDINLCRLYVWRWNISADYDAEDRLVRLYVNGEQVVGPDDGTNGVRPVQTTGGGEQMLQGQRPRPEADLGESSLGFIVYDRDLSHDRAGDLVLVMGAGPTRADPANLGYMYAYSQVDYWRSIFDSSTVPIAPYQGSCPN